MSAIKNGQISLYCHFNKIIQGPGTSFQSAELSQENVRNVYHISNCNFHYVAILMMMSQILKSVDFTKTQKSRYLESKTLFFSWNKKDLSITHYRLLYGKISFVPKVIFKERKQKSDHKHLLFCTLLISLTAIIEFPPLIVSVFKKKKKTEKQKLSYP